MRFILEGIIVNNFSGQIILLVDPSDLISCRNVIQNAQQKKFQDEHVCGQFLEVKNNRRLVQADKNKSSSQRR